MFNGKHENTLDSGLFNIAQTSVENNSLLNNLLLVSRDDRNGGWAKLALSIVRGKLNVQQQL